MCDIIFAFGQRGGYHFETPSKWQFDKLPGQLERLFNSNEGTGVATCYSLVLGAGESFLVSYNGKDGLDHIQSDGIPDALRTFLYAKNSAGECVRDFPNIRVALGPYNKSYWATDGSSFSWLNLPAGLQEAIRAQRGDGGTGDFIDAPRLVALGADENYFMATKNNAASWSLGGYLTLQEVVRGCKDNDAGVSNMQNLVLHPYRLQTFVLQTKSGFVAAENLPPFMEEPFETIRAAVREDTEKGIRRLSQAEQDRAVQQQLLEQRRARQLRQMGQTAYMMTALFAGLTVGNLST